jgi:hypothetical protein
VQPGSTQVDPDGKKAWPLSLKNNSIAMKDAETKLKIINDLVVFMGDAFCYSSPEIVA